ncbi:MAG TPA: hypothetical protein H9768_08155 [Candidatus Mailhella merdavium]|nr:hypothetical protein [Candidatus Mailhella merdavium]
MFCFSFFRTTRGKRKYGIVSDKLIFQTVSVAREDGMPGLLQDCALQVEISGQNI